MNLNLKGRVAIVTGGGSGIGRATALAFAAEGAHVAIWDIDAEAAKTVAACMASASTRAIDIACDVADEASVGRALAVSVERLGPIDHLVHGAAVGSGKFGFPFSNLAPADWLRVLQVNIMGMTHVAHALGPHLSERGKGSMVFLSSIAGQIGSQTDPPYSASKAANINFAQCLAKDLGPRGVRVNTVCPGLVKTPLNRAVWQAWHNAAAVAERMSYEEWSQRKIHTMMPLGRWQTPEAVADMIVFLSSDRAAHVTGQTINVDGGCVMHA
jgi:2-hydroxycyclohexanecarboxyl-CoA dehydrogenase